jgi:hypothetical protein
MRDMPGIFPHDQRISAVLLPCSGLDAQMQVDLDEVDIDGAIVIEELDERLHALVLLDPAVLTKGGVQERETFLVRVQVQVAEIAPDSPAESRTLGGDIAGIWVLLAHGLRLSGRLMRIEPFAAKRVFIRADLEASACGLVIGEIPAFPATLVIRRDLRAPVFFLA